MAVKHKIGIWQGLQWAVRLLYPERCPICDGILYRPIWESEYQACKECKKKIKYIREPLCKKCGKPLMDERKEFCSDCGRQEHLYVQGKALLLYKGSVKESIYRFKYGNRREYGRFYGQEIYKQYAVWLRQCELDAIIPVPLHKARKRQRGFNQAEIVAREIGNQMDIPVITGLLIRTVNTRPQKELNDKERKNNLKKAFKITKNNVQLKHILLVDDIYTTGNTMDEAADVLKDAGVRKVYVISVSIGKGD